MCAKIRILIDQYTSIMHLLTKILFLDPESKIIGLLLFQIILSIKCKSRFCFDIHVPVFSQKVKPIIICPSNQPVEEISPTKIMQQGENLPHLLQFSPNWGFSLPSNSSLSPFLYQFFPLSHFPRHFIQIYFH